MDLSINQCAGIQLNKMHVSFIYKCYDKCTVKILWFEIDVWNYDKQIYYVSANQALFYIILLPKSIEIIKYSKKLMSLIYFFFIFYKIIKGSCILCNLNSLFLANFNFNKACMYYLNIQVKSIIKSNLKNMLFWLQTLRYFEWTCITI